MIAAHLTDELDVHPHLATVVASLADRLAIEGWHVTTSYPARPVAPRAREAPRARRSLARLLRRARTNGETAP
ncbi:hypothetical protein QCN29_02165 [Streptomyces sp. HNM0663]|uniref:Uncharacterized protein n=1 Tax=Streptomyces chengmaiensis TaxID=3040919 RepID=A0ABT6HH38_9ACTN|nr:hypothetical protein [Streptomyces chengmaiensis]MDH2387610.1 hypothetical protein [Streptomyces chengmaiensis]